MSRPHCALKKWPGPMRALLVAEVITKPAGPWRDQARHQRPYGSPAISVSRCPST
jgi:hypothetical protein